MATAYPFAAIQSTDQWRRVAHDNTRLLTETPGFSLKIKETVSERRLESCNAAHQPLAADPWCRLYRLNIETGQITRWRWSAIQQGGAVEKDSVNVLEDPAGAPGEFDWAADQLSVLNKPGGMAIDSGGHLFIAETGSDRIHIFDLVDRRLLRCVVLPAGSRPAAMASGGDEVFVVVTAGVLRLSALADPVAVKLSPEIAQINRIAAIEDELVGLVEADTADARIVSLTRGIKSFTQPFTTDLTFIDNQHLVVARGCDRDFIQYRYLPLNWQDRPLEIKRFRAKAYDGRGIVATNDGRIGYFSSKGFKTALRIKPRYETRGSVVTFALDSGVFQNQWGIAYVDACVPVRCGVRVNFHASDELPEFHLFSRIKAFNDNGFGELLHEELSPTMPEQRWITDLDAASGFRLYRRGNDDELVWDEATEGGVATYECPVHAGPGRYLWLTLELTGSGKQTPTINTLRVQKHGHDLLAHLPKLYSRDARVNSFLKRYLAMPDNLLSYFDTASFMRHALLDPCSSPREMLPWLAGFVGLVLDERFNEAVRRRLIEGAVWLFRFRGTVEGLKTFLQIYLDVQVVIIEYFKVRGLGGALVGAEHPEQGNAVLGAGYRVGLALGSESSLVGGDDIQFESPGDERHAHRFSVLIPALLTSEQLDVVNHIIARHRPAHTLFDVCTVEAGMRIGRGLHLELTSIIGHSGGFLPLQVDGSTLGRGSIAGSAPLASTVSGGRLDINARLG